MMKLIITKIALVLLIIGTATITGCEKQVVRESYSPLTGMNSGSDPRTDPNRTHIGQPVAKKKKGFFEGIGDFMFGWMDDSDSKPKQEPKSSAVRKPMWEGHEQYRTQTSPSTGSAP